MDISSRTTIPLKMSVLGIPALKLIPVPFYSDIGADPPIPPRCGVKHTTLLLCFVNVSIVINQPGLKDTLPSVKGCGDDLQQRRQKNKNRDHQFRQALHRSRCFSSELVHEQALHGGGFRSRGLAVNHAGKRPGMSSWPRPKRAGIPCRAELDRELCRTANF